MKHLSNMLRTAALAGLLAIVAGCAPGYYGHDGYGRGDRYEHRHGERHDGNRDDRRDDDGRH